MYILQVKKHRERTGADMVAMVTGTRNYGGMAMGASWADADFAYMVVEFFAFGTFDVSVETATTLST